MPESTIIQKLVDQALANIVDNRIRIVHEFLDLYPDPEARKVFELRGGWRMDECKYVERIVLRSSPQEEGETVLGTFI